MDFLRQLYEDKHSSYHISVDDLLDSGAKRAIEKYMDDEYGVSLEDALDAISGGDKDFDNDVQAKIIEDAKRGVKAAIYYCFYRCYGKIITNYKMFNGKSQSYTDKITGETKEAYITYAYLALAGDFSDIQQSKLKNKVARTTLDVLDDVDTYFGLSSNALELYKPESIGSSRKPFAALARIFEGCLQTIIRTYIPKMNARGINYQGSDVTKVDLTNGDASKGASLVSMDKEIDDEHSGASTVGEKISSEKGGYKGVEQTFEENADLTDWIDMCSNDPDLYRVYKTNIKGEEKEITAFDDFTNKKRPIFPCDVLKAYIVAIDKYRGDADRSSVNNELKTILGVDKLQPMQWSATGHNAGRTDTPNEEMIAILKAYSFSPLKIATLIHNFGSDELNKYIDDQIHDDFE